MELMQWLFTSIDEIIDCDYINNQEEKTELKMIHNVKDQIIDMIVDSTAELYLKWEDEKSNEKINGLEEFLDVLSDKLKKVLEI